MKNLKEKIGYGFGDMASSMFWKVFSYYLPFFYSNIFGLSLVDAGILVLVTRVWDAVSDPMMGIVADRTRTRWGKYRPYLLWVAAPFSVCGILLFTTPDFSYLRQAAVGVCDLHTYDDGVHRHQCALWRDARRGYGQSARKDRVLVVPYAFCLRRLFRGLVLVGSLVPLFPGLARSLMRLRAGSSPWW